jgi:hypothetical protein
MPANTAPIFTLRPEIMWNVSITAANNTGDLTSGTVYVWINNGSTTTTAANNTLFDEITIAANATFVTNAASTNYELPLMFALPPNYIIYVTIGAAAAGGIDATVIGGDY